MQLFLFSTMRQIRDFISENRDTLLPKTMTLGDFFQKSVVVKNAKFIDQENRIIYLYKAVQKVKTDTLGFRKEFLSFIKNSEFIFKFFEELFAERVQLQELFNYDTYQEYEEHLSTLLSLFNAYKTLLKENSLTDKILIETYEVNEGFLSRFDKIELFIDGYLTAFEVEVLSRITQPLTLHLLSTPFNKKLRDNLSLSLEEGYRYTVEWQSKKILSQTKLPFVKDNIECVSFSHPLSQLNFVFEKIESVIKSGAKPENVAVILPDESLSEALKLFDEQKNLNYAMGTSFTKSRYYHTLHSLYLYLVKDDLKQKEIIFDPTLMDRFSEVKSFKDFVDFVHEVKTNDQENRIIEEELFKLKKFESHLQDVESIYLLHYFLNRLCKLSFDDVNSGKITVMGVLESRGKEYDAVIITDFNEGVVPSVSEKDLFLNDFLRTHASLPTRQDKDNLQKNYYYSLFLHAKQVSLCYLQNDEKNQSRFLYELGLPTSTPKDYEYAHIVYPPSEKKVLYDAPIIAPFKDTRFTPSKLKTLLDCKRKFYYKYVRKIDNKEEKNRGISIHEALHKTLITPPESLESYEEKLFSTLYKEASVKERFDLEVEWEESLRRFCKKDFETLQRYSRELETWLSEIEVNGFYLSSNVDRLDKNDEEIILIDYKTNRDVSQLLKDDHNFQLLFYALWAKKNHAEKNIITGFYDLKNSHFIEVDAFEKESALYEALESLPKENMNYEKCEDSKLCYYCEYQTACGREL